MLTLAERLAEIVLRGERRSVDRLARAAEVLASEHDLDHLLMEVLDLGLGVTGARFGVLALFREGEPHRIAQIAHAGAWGPVPPAAVPVAAAAHASGLSNLLRGRSRPIRTMDPGDIERWLPPGHPEAGSLMVAPIRRHGRPLGVLLLAGGRGRGFSDEDEVQVTGLVRLTGVAVENAELFGREEATLARLRELNRLRSDFVSMVIHELRNPIGTIRGYGRLLAAAEDHERDEMAEAIVQQADRMARLVDEVLDVSRIEGGAVALGLVDYDSRALLSGCVEEARVAWPTRALDLHLDGTPTRVVGDPDRMRQVVQNLLSNACRYSTADAPVTVRGGVFADELRITVSDRGPGIAPAEASGLFRRFGRLPEAERLHPGGAGLGLYISRRIVEAHGGRIWVESEQGAGASFHVAVPLAGPGQPDRSVPGRIP